MCIIIAKEKEGNLPSVDTLKTCFNHNSDGAGLMYVDKGQVVIEKGFMSFNELEKHFSILCKKFNNFKDKALVIHCRIGTSGTNTKENTHPYCISENYKDLHKTRVLCDLGMVHNGIIHEYTPVDNKYNTNDTQEFIMKYIAPMYEHYRDFYKNEYVLNGLKDITGSKLVFLDTNEDLYFVGDFIEDNGVKYSNGTYKPYSYVYNKYYDWDDRDYYYYWDEKAKKYLNEGYTYLEDKTKIDTTKTNVKRLEKLEPTWIIGNERGCEKVGDRDFYIDPFTYDLYEKVNNEYIKIGEETYVYDEQYCELY